MFCATVLVMDREWKDVESIPKDGSTIEVEAGPHGIIKVFYDPQKPPYIGIWRKAKDRGGILLPIYPDKWREVA